jgi:hypothetical protein
VSFLARLIQMPTLNLEDMLHERVAIPNWVFLRAVDFINECEAQSIAPPGMPGNWRELSDRHKP